jgi:hypothetical protein
MDSLTAKTGFIREGIPSMSRCRILWLAFVVCMIRMMTSASVDSSSEIYAMHFPDVSALPCPLVDDVRLYDSITRVYNKILESSRDDNTAFGSKLSDLYCLAGTDHYYTDSHMRISMAFFEQGIFPASIRHCLLSLTRNPFLPHCWNMMQESYYRIGNFRRAFFYSTYSEIVFPDHVNICYNGSRSAMLADYDGLNADDLDLFDAGRYLEHLNSDGHVRGTLIDPVDAEIYLLGLESSVDSDSLNLIQKKCVEVFRQGIIDIPNLGSTDGNMPWPATSIVKIYYPNLKGFQVPFADSTLALSQHLSLLGIPNKIVSTLPPLNTSDTSLFVFLHGTPYSKIFERLPLHYVLWNSEKQPSVSLSGVAHRSLTKLGREYVDPGEVGFGISAIDNTDTIVYPHSFIEVAVLSTYFVERLIHAVH